MIKKKGAVRQPDVATSDLTLVLAMTAAVFLLRLCYLKFLHPYGLAPDEAQYWTWLQHNDWSFLTKPPLTTWLIGVSTFVFGDTLIGVKFFALVSQGATAVLAYLLAREVTQDVRVSGSQDIRERAGWWAFGLMTTLPLVAGGGLLMSPDAVLMPLWLGAMLSVSRALNAEREARALCWSRWVMLGVLIGLGGLAKYSAAVFAPLLGLYLLIWKRHWLLKPQVWAAGAVALAFQLPVILWNAQHEWVGLAHVLWQAEGGGVDEHGGIGSFFEFLGSQALVLGPVVFGLVLVALVKGSQGLRMSGSQGGAARFLWVVAVGILGGFAVMAFTTKVQANWPVLGAVTAVVVVAVWLARVRTKWVVWLALAGILLNGTLTGILMDTYKARDAGIFPLKAKNDPTKDLRGWEEMGQLVGLLMYKLNNPLILSSRYQTLAPLMFHTIGSPEFAYLNAEGRRLNEYDVWPTPDFTGRLVVYVSENGKLPEKVGAMFGQCEPWHSLGVEEYGITVRTMRLWLCWGRG